MNVALIGPRDSLSIDILAVSFLPAIVFFAEAANTRLPSPPPYCCCVAALAIEGLALMEGKQWLVARFSCPC